MNWQSLGSNSHIRTLFAFIFAALTNFSIFNVASKYINNPYILIISSIIPACYTAYFSLHILLLSRYPRISDVASSFHPFRKTGDTNFVPLPRDREVLRLKEKLRYCTNKHLIITGPSGSGKTTLVCDLFKSDDSEFSPHFVSQYENPFNQLIISLFSKVDPNSASELRIELSKISLDHPIYIDDMINSRVSFARMEDVTKLIDNCVANIPLGTVFVLDQCERFLSYFDKQMSDNNISVSTYLFLLALERLRLCRNANTIYVVRSEYYFSAVSFLDLISKPSESDRNAISYFLLTGIDQYNSPEAVFEFDRWFSAIDGASTYSDQIAEVLHLRARGRSNTFVTQLYGWLVSGYYASISAVRQLVKDSAASKIAIREFFKLLEGDFFSHGNGRLSKQYLRATLNAIAFGNKQTGEPVTSYQISHSVQIQYEVVECIVNYLNEAGILEPDTIAGTKGYRIVHELLTDHILSDPKFSISAEWSEAIHNIIVNTPPNGEPTSDGSIPNLIVGKFSPMDINAWLIIAFLIHGLVTVSNTETCLASAQFFGQIMPAAMRQASCESYAELHTYVMVPQLLWMWYMHTLASGFIWNAVKHSVWKYISLLLPALGVVLAFLLAHYPEYIFVPIAVVGFCFGVTLVSVARSGEFKGEFADNTSSWGAKTALNMAWTLVATALVGGAFVAERNGLSPSSISGEYGLGIIGQIGWARFAVGASAVIMIWYWSHIRKDQQSAVSISERLAQSVRARSE